MAPPQAEKAAAQANDQLRPENIRGSDVALGKRPKQKRSSLRVLTFTSLFPNSVVPSHGIFVYRRVAATARVAGLDDEIIAPIPYSPRWIRGERWNKLADVPASESISGLRVHHPRYPLLPKISMQMHGLLMYLGARKLALQLHTHRPFDCIDAHYVYPDGFAAVMLGKLLGVPVVVSARGTDINLFPSFRTIRPLILWTLRNCTGIIAVSEALKRQMVELGIPEEKIQFIGNGVETDLFNIGDRKEARRWLGLPGDARILVSVASLRESKGHQHVIAALAGIVPRHPELKLYIVGEGDYRAKIERQIRDLGLHERVILVGNRKNEEMPLWFNAADASILASSQEGWPNVILESLACGTPVIGTPVGQIPEILRSSDLGIVCKQDVHSIASAIEQALCRNWQRETLSHFAHNRPWSKVAEEMESYLATIAGSTTAARAGSS